MVIFLIIALAVVSLYSTAISETGSYNKVYAQQQQSAESQIAKETMTSAAVTVNNNNNISNNDNSNGSYSDTFNASRLVASWAEYENQATSSASNTTTTVVSIPYVIAGPWNLQVVNGDVKSFNVNMTMVKGDGSDYHNHSIFNFKPLSHSLTKTLFLSKASTASSSRNLTSSTLELAPNSTLSIPGTADIFNKWQN